jgi:hypothetical protein
MASTRETVAARANHCCEYCRLPDFVDPNDGFHVDHVIARQHGGGDNLENLSWACSRCNRRKGTNLSAVDPIDGSTAPVFNPRLGNWNDHFLIQSARVVGQTAVGRATVRLLDMNAIRRVELREAAIRAGLWNVSPG